MSDTFIHDAVEPLLTAFALDALETDEAAMVTKHLASCPRCRQEASADWEVASLITADAPAPPQEVWERILVSLDAAPPPLRLVSAPVGPRTRHRRRRAAMGLAAIAAALVGLVGLSAMRQTQRPGATTAALGQDRLGRVALAAFSDPRAKRSVLIVDGAPGPRVAVLPDGSGYVVNTGLPPLKADKGYELWAVTGGQRVKAAMLARDASVTPFHASSAVDAFAITVEAPEGVVSSTREPVASGLVGA